jgi:hypothetical protein
MKKVAVLVQAYVATRVVIEVPDDFDMDHDELAEDMCNEAERLAIPRLKNNLCSDCIDSIEVDYEVPYDAKHDVEEWG